ncbi:MAG TPA: hypothetical protein VEM34_01060 [Burkholderiales bacterium]|nr:hypothetical protein [Burkholderiales bacterium]
MEFWVIDTSSITEVRRIVPADRQVAVYAGLTELVVKEVLVFPKQVVGELRNYTGSPKNKPDLPYDWATKNEGLATRFGFSAASLRKVLSHSLARRVVDPDKSGAEEADPYVLELGIRLKEQGHEVTILTEDRKDKPEKISLHTAASILRLVPLGVEAFLEVQNIWNKRT